MKAKHIATYPLYAKSHPLSDTYSTRRIGTGYVYGPTDYFKIRSRLTAVGHPFHPRWRNDQCRLEFMQATSKILT